MNDKLLPSARRLAVDPGFRRDDIDWPRESVIPAKVPPRARHGAGIHAP